MKGLIESLYHLEKSFREKGLVETAVKEFFHHPQLEFKAELSGNNIDGQILKKV